ncbi:NUDIX hydrolase [Neptunomonas marina]|uniref:Phosphatase NudJ n=1 Tax=Neptunomonas marina TaxID=1815562 RepID=A0A437Q8Y7_9GAMM|nr:NUDIX hydrolase [Neptunomonas marina]RVU31054.1 NUDIX hydrolase [Neptunomonas marina]
MIWTPRATVAVIVEQNEKYLMVEEIDNGEHRFNQPAGHLEDGETIHQGAIRETLEETGYNVQLTGVIGLYAASAANGTTYHRVCYCADIKDPIPSTELDADIVAVHWLTYEEIKEREAQLRSPMVLACIEDYRDNRRFPLDLIRQL